jgi:hypothetical protein
MSPFIIFGIERSSTPVDDDIPARGTSQWKADLRSSRRRSQKRQEVAQKGQVVAARAFYLSSRFEILWKRKMEADCGVDTNQVSLEDSREKVSPVLSHIKF